MEGVVQYRFAYTLCAGEGKDMSIKTKSRFPRVSRIMSCGSNPETPKKIYTASKSVSLSCCRLCKSVGDISHWRNLYSKGNSQLLATAEDLYGKTLPRRDVLPHLVCRPCERRLTNFRKFKITVSESQASFEVKVKRCLEESPSAPHTIKSLKARKDANMAGNVPVSRTRRGLCFASTQSPQVSPILFRCLFSFPLLYVVHYFQCQFSNNRM